jgi:hypothetical protein
MNRRAFARVCAGGMLLAGGCGKSSTGPVGYEALPATAGTVQAALDLFTTGNVLVPTVCDSAATTKLNCPGGVPGSPVYITVRRDSLSIVYNMPADRFDYAVKMKLVTPVDIPVTIALVGECGLHLDTTPGADSLVQIVGTASFRSHIAGEPIDELDFSTPVVNGLTSDDMALTGGTGCLLANMGLSFYVETLQAMIGPPALSLCGAPGPPLFVACETPPPVPYAAPRGRS